MMSIVLPKEHGTWMMFLLPSLLGILLSTFHFSQIIFILGWFFLYLSATPILNIYRNPKKKNVMMPWLLTYLLLAAVFLIPLLYYFPKISLIEVCILPFLFINLIFIKKKNERHFLNDLAAILIFCIGGLSVFYLGDGKIFTQEGLTFLSLPVLYFIGSVFFVKSLIRERTNLKFRSLSHIYHFLLLLAPIISGSAIYMLLFLPNLIKDWFTPRGYVIKPLYCGIIEMVNGIIFFIFCFLLIKQ